MRQRFDCAFVQDCPAAENCDWIAFLNPDAFAASDWLEKMAEAAEKHPEYTSFGSHMIRYESDKYFGSGLGDITEGLEEVIEKST